jgi:transposase
MKEASIIGLDLAKRSFQAHGALADGSVAFRRKLTREKVLGFLAEQPRCVVAMGPAGAPITGVGLSATPGMKFA